MPVSEWQAATDRFETALRELRPQDCYTGITQSDAEIDAAFTKEFKLPSEWGCNDIVEIITGTTERQSGVITGPIEDERVMVLFADGIHWSYPVIGCYVRRNQT